MPTTMNVHGVATFGGIATTRASKILRQCLLIGLNAFGSSILPLGTLTENIETIKFGNTTRCLSGCNISPWHGGLTAASAHEEWSWEPVTDTAAPAFTDNASGSLSSVVPKPGESSGDPAPGVSSGDLAPEPAPTPTPAASAPHPMCNPHLLPSHDIEPKDDIDWSLPENKSRFDWIAQAWRNLVLKDYLKQGIEVQYQATDNSLWPHVCSGDVCHFEPARPRIDTLRIGNIVFCQIQDGTLQVQVIRQIISTPAESAPDSGEFRRRFVIGNYNNDVGYAHDDEVYGRLFQVRSVHSEPVGTYGSLPWW